MAMTDEQFDEVVDRALRSIPQDLWDEIENVEIIVDDEALDQPHLLGLYHGIPLTKRTVWGAGGPPSEITIFRGPLRRLYGGDPKVLQEQIRVTILHEVGHYFGIGEERLHELGYGAGPPPVLNSRTTRRPVESEPASEWADPEDLEDRANAERARREREGERPPHY